MFRRASDALGTLEELKHLGVRLHMLDLGGVAAIVDRPGMMEK